MSVMLLQAALAGHSVFSCGFQQCFEFMDPGFKGCKRIQSSDHHGWKWGLQVFCSCWVPATSSLQWFCSAEVTSQCNFYSFDANFIQVDVMLGLDPTEYWWDADCSTDTNFLPDLPKCTSSLRSCMCRGNLTSKTSHVISWSLTSYFCVCHNQGAMFYLIV